MKGVAVKLAIGALLALALGACGRAGPVGPQPTSTGSGVPTSSTVQSSSEETETTGPTSSDRDTTSQETDDVSPAGEIWQWAIGRNVWTDPHMEKYTYELGRSDTDVNVQSEGFQLTLDGSGTVTAVTLYNDETALGFPGSGSNFSAYEGSLPGRFTWKTTADDVGAVYGAPNQSGGFGTEISFAYTSGDGYRLQVAFNARHEADLEGSLIHCITVTHE